MIGLKLSLCLCAIGLINGECQDYFTDDQICNGICDIGRVHFTQGVAVGPALCCEEQNCIGLEESTLSTTDFNLYDIDVEPVSFSEGPFWPYLVIVTVLLCLGAFVLYRLCKSI